MEMLISRLVYPYLTKIDIGGLTVVSCNDEEDRESGNRVVEPGWSQDAMIDIGWLYVDLMTACLHWSGLVLADEISS